jgi:hypothetical protein
MRVDDLERALHELAAEQPAVSETAQRDVIRRVRRRRLRNTGALLVALAALVAIPLVALRGSSGRTRVATVPAATSPASAPPTTAHVASTPRGEAIPPGFSPVSVTFVPARTGWVLGTAVCTTQPCSPFLLRTTDGGATWSSVPPPPSPVSAVAADVGAHSVRFANLEDGWVFGPELWATHDGGSHWARTTLPGLPADVRVEALEASNGAVHAAVLDGAEVRILSSAVGRDDWQLSSTVLSAGEGPVPSTQIVLHGATGWIVQLDRTVTGGARLDGGQWIPWQPPCADVFGPAVLAASTATDLIAVCDEGVWGGSGPRGSHLYVSANGGAAFQRSATTVPVSAGVVASAAPGAAVVGGPIADGSALVATSDGGARWTTVYQDRHYPAWLDLGFTTGTQGVVVEIFHEGPAALLLTRDGGRTWSPVRFGSGRS